MKKNKAPCQDCKERTATCHTDCEKYAVRKTEYNAQREAEKNQRKLYTTHRGYASDRYHRLTRRKD